MELYNYPDGDADLMENDEIVLRITSASLVSECRTGELFNGDLYCYKTSIDNQQLQ
jgi:hypothetical protein